LDLTISPTGRDGWADGRVGTSSLGKRSESRPGADPGGAGFDQCVMRALINVLHTVPAGCVPLSICCMLPPCAAVCRRVPPCGSPRAMTRAAALLCWAVLLAAVDHVAGGTMAVLRLAFGDVEGAAPSPLSHSWRDAFVSPTCGRACNAFVISVTAYLSPFLHFSPSSNR